MKLGTPENSESRFAGYVEALMNVIGHADRCRPLRDYCTGLMLRAIARVGSRWRQRQRRRGRRHNIGPRRARKNNQRGRGSLRAASCKRPASHPAAARSQAIQDPLDACPVPRRSTPVITAEATTAWLGW
jgi:hypothetical protein